MAVTMVITGWAGLILAIDFMIGNTDFEPQLNEMLSLTKRITFFS